MSDRYEFSVPSIMGYRASARPSRIMTRKTCGTCGSC